MSMCTGSAANVINKKKFKHWLVTKAYFFRYNIIDVIRIGVRSFLKGVLTLDDNIERKRQVRLRAGVQQFNNKSVYLLPTSRSLVKVIFDRVVGSEALEPNLIGKILTIRRLRSITHVQLHRQSGRWGKADSNFNLRVSRWGTQWKNRLVEEHGSFSHKSRLTASGDIYSNYLS